MLPRDKLRRVVRAALGRPDATSRKYWERAAKVNPYAFICTGWDAAKFDSEIDNPVIAPELLDKEKVILDLACGIGRLAKFVAPKVKLYVGVDFSSGMIEKARERYKEYSNVSFVHNDGKSLGVLSDNTFDLALCYLAFQHMSRSVTKSYVDEVHRVLKPGGIFVTDIPRLDYYKDGKYAFSKEQCTTLFDIYSRSEYRPETAYAYFIVQATK